MIRRNPTTVGGKTRGSIRAVSTSAFPRKDLRASPCPANIPATNTTTHATMATSREREIGVQNSENVRLLS
jgi:hypothetical protein